ncbi:MAG: hypothetical protein Kow00104_12970 [Rhodothalassiaceae bacterium]
MPRAANPVAEPAPVAGVLLAAGRSTRMGTANKLLLAPPSDPRPLVRIAAETALSAGLAPLIVVLGHQARAILDALSGLAILPVPARDHARGMAHSLRAGIAAVPESALYAAILLADMPAIAPATLAALLETAAGSDAPAILPACRGRRGHPVLWHRRMFGALRGLSGDIGGRDLLAALGDEVLVLETGDSGILKDIDDPESLADFADSAPDE